MRNYLLILLCAIVTQITSAQVGIGNTDPKAVLDISASNQSNPSNTDGLLIPRIDAFPTTDPTIDQQGMMVYLTTIDGSYTPGMYSWDSSTATWLSLMDVKETLLEDTDADTKIQVEESADEDIIRFDIAGTEYFKMQAGRVQVSNTNNNVFYGNDAGDLIATGSRNTAFGTDPLNDLTTGGQNIAIGDRPLHKLTTGSNNIGIGSRTMNNKISGDFNVVLGRDALRSNTTGSHNIVMGLLALSDNLTGGSNIAIGSYAGRRNLGEKSVFIGNAAGANETDSNRLYVDNSNTSSPLIYGEFDANLLRVNGTLDINDAYQLPIADGTTGQVLSTDGAGAVSWSTSGTNTIIEDADGDTIIQVEESADDDIIRFDMAGTERFRFDGGRMEFVNSNANIFIGESVGQNYATGGGNVALGDKALSNFSGGPDNIAIGESAFLSATAISYNVGIGWRVGYNQTGGSKNVLLGYLAGAGATAHSKSNNTMLGHQAGQLNEGDANVFLGFNAGMNESGSNKLYIENTNTNSPLIYGEFDTNLLRVNGTLDINNAYKLPTADGITGQVITTDGTGNTTWSSPGTSNIIQDADSDTKIQVEESADEDIIRFDLAGTEYFRMATGRLETINTGGSVIIGEGAGINDDFTDNSNVIIGEESGIALTTGGQNVVLGKNAMQVSAAGSHNVAIGAEAGRNQPSGGNNVFVGNASGVNAGAVNNNVAIGVSTLAKVASHENVAIGPYTLRSATTGSKNIGLGAQTLLDLDTGGSNIAIGYVAQGKNVSGNSNIAIGYAGLYNNLTGGSNITLGNDALHSNLSGSSNIAIGTAAGGDNVGSNNLFLGNQAGQNELGSNTLYMDNTSTASPLIYGEFDNDLLRVNGTLDINNEYQLPLTDGTAGQVLSTDGSGNAVWSDAGVEAETTTIVFESNWSQYGGDWEQVTYYKDRDRVYIDGLTRTSATIGTFDHIFTLPTGYRPAGKVITLGVQAEFSFRVEIHPDGKVYVLDSSGTSVSDYVSLSGISFRVN